MENIKMEDLSNNELKIKLKEINDEFEALKIETSNKMKRLEELSINYNKCNEILQNRTNGRII